MSSETQSGTSTSLSEIERRMARYLFAISVLRRPNTDRITTGELNEYLNVTPASVTEMVSKLDDRGLVDYEKYQGVILTDQGNALAMQAGWRFCAVSTFFDSVLDTRLDEKTAFDIGFVLPKNGVSRLLGHVNSACLKLCPESNGDVGGCVA